MQKMSFIFPRAHTGYDEKIGATEIGATESETANKDDIFDSLAAANGSFYEELTLQSEKF